MKTRFVVAVCSLVAWSAGARTSTAAPVPNVYQYRETRDLVALVNDAAKLVSTRGEAAFEDFRLAGSPWRRGETYVFVLDLQGNMLVHPDPAMEGKNELNLKDVNGKPIIKGLLAAATAVPGQQEGWSHYEWPVPGGLLPRWKSTYVREVATPGGKRFVIGAGMYDDRMEKAFVVDMVKHAVADIEKSGEAAFPLLRDPKGPYIAKDTYVFVIDPNGVELVNPAFPNLEKRNVLDVKDTQGKPLNRAMLEVVKTRGSGWVDYLWPKPGESVSTQKSAYVSRAKLGEQWVLVGCGVYLADAPKSPPVAGKMTAPALMGLVRDAAAVLEKDGEAAYAEFGKKGSRWFKDDTYLFVWSIDGIQTFNAGEPASNGQNRTETNDIHGRPIGKMILQTAASAAGERWIHYMYPKPGEMFPTWKSTFVKRVRFPAGRQYVVGCGIYEMRMDKAFVEDVVNRAADLVAVRGAEAFPVLRDKTGPFVFMDTYVFVDTPDGTEVVNPGTPGVEGKNLMDMRDAKGKLAIREYIDAAMKEGSAWVSYYWYKPGHNTLARKESYVRMVRSGRDTYIVGAGLYPEEPAQGAPAPAGRRP